MRALMKRLRLPDSGRQELRHALPILIPLGGDALRLESPMPNFRCPSTSSGNILES